VSQVAVEQILVVPTSVFHALGHFQGFQGDADFYLSELLKPEHMSYRPRPDMEKDPRFKQLIPYAIFHHRDAEGRQFVFQYTRGKGQGENRLHSKKSVGIGGHISSDDALDVDSDPYREGLRRELEEEVIIGSTYTERCVGLINDDQSEVGRVHLGIVHLFSLDEPNVQPRESEIIECGFRPIDEMLADLEGFETWSSICLKALFA
jgi:predicted NUDIX family phosphoesterase